MPHLLVVEPDPQIQRMLRGHLTAAGYRVTVCEGGPGALMAAVEVEPDLILLETALPGMDGVEVCTQLREWSHVPILFLSGVHDPQEKIRALDSGGDDYVTKPFHTGELLARIRAALRRTANSAERPGTLAAGRLTLDPNRRRTLFDGTEIALTRTEFDLLRELLAHADYVLSYSHLLRVVWGAEQDNMRLVQVHMGNLRRKLRAHAPDVPEIVAVPSIGYRLSITG